MGKPRQEDVPREHIFCGACGKRHVDRGEWATRVHRTHLCEHCGAEFGGDEYVFGVCPDAPGEPCTHGPDADWACPACRGGK